MDRGIICEGSRATAIHKAGEVGASFSSAVCRPSLSARVCPARLATASHHCTEMGANELEFSSCLVHGISLLPVTKTGTFFSPWKPESVLFMYLCPQIAWEQWACVLREEQTRKKSEGKSILSGRLDPHPRRGHGCAQAPGHHARAGGASGAAVNSRASPAANFSPTP